MKIAVTSLGKMGHRLEQQISESKNDFVSPDSNLQTADNLTFSEQPDIVIDFSHPAALSKVLKAAKDYQVPLVSGTTGYSSEAFAQLKAAGESLPVLYSANFSLGVLVLNHLAKEAARLLADWDIELIEKHHHQKVDVPSGTAKMLLASVNPDGRLTENIGRHEAGQRSPHEIGVHSLRGGSIPGEHELFFAGADEVVSLKHEALSGMIFAQGALKAADWLIKQPAGFYSMDNVLFRNEDK